MPSMTMIQAIREHNEDLPEDEWARFIDVIGDKSESEAKDFLLTSVLFDYTGVYTELIESLERGEFGEVLTMSVENDGVRLLEPPIEVDEETWAEVEATRQAIINGEIEVSSIGDAEGMHERLEELFPDAE